MSVLVEMYAILEQYGSRKTRKYKADPARRDIERDIKMRKTDTSTNPDRDASLARHKSSRGVKKRRGAKVSSGKKMVFGKLVKTG